MLEQVVSLVREDPRVSWLSLFGSGGRGTDGTESDVDLAVWLDVPRDDIGEVLLELRDRLSRAIGRDLDLVDLNRAPILLRHQIQRDGRLLHERDHEARLAYESRTLQEAIDFEPIRRRCAAGMVRSLRKEVGGGS